MPQQCILHFNDSKQTAYRNAILQSMDTVLYYSHKDINGIKNVMSFEFNLFSNCLKENELILNCRKGKTENMVFGTNPPTEKLERPFTLYT